MISLATKVAILQQSEYEWPRFLSWFERHKDENIKVEPKKLTPKYALILVSATFLRTFFAENNALHLALRASSLPESTAKTIIIRLATIKLRILQLLGLKIVAVAGSYAKTSTKHILFQTLSPYIPVLATPESVNTPLGIAFTILTKVHRKHRLFIAELGAYTKGDVAGLVRFVRPNYGILTPIGIEHLERFGSFEKIVEAESELISTLPIEVLSNDGNIPLLPDSLKPPRVKFYGFFPRSQYDISNLSLTKSGTECTLAVKENTYHVFIPLFGKHNIVNILPSFWIGEKFGLTTEQIINTLSMLKPIPHRLEPIITETGVLILDNGYNTSPGSSVESLSVLKDIPAKKRILVTPGFVELGEKQSAYNEDFGERIADVADIVCITGKTNADALTKGLLNKKFSKKNILYAENENEAVEKLQSHLLANSVLLFEGGTPEVYQ